MWNWQKTAQSSSPHHCMYVAAPERVSSAWRYEEDPDIIKKLDEIIGA
jgi:hypothetical protein